jgi:hypothetical protein
LTRKSYTNRSASGFALLIAVTLAQPCASSFDVELVLKLEAVDGKETVASASLEAPAPCIHAQVGRRCFQCRHKLMVASLSAQIRL